MRTVDDAAKAPGDFEAKNELITMKAHEKERKIQINIVDDDQWEPDKDFKVQLLDEVDQEVLPGADTECIITILDEDKPGNIGFKERFVTVKRKDEFAFIEVERIDGSDGDINCKAETINDVDILPGKRQAVEHKDFVPFKGEEIEFKKNEVSMRIKVEMPDCEEETPVDDDEGEGGDVVSFAIKLYDPFPEAVKLSRKDTCFIDIEPNNSEEDIRMEKERAQMVDYFVANKEITWGQQFKVACMLGPSVDSDNLLVDVDTVEAILHLFGMPWKVVFATIPPRKMCGGWLAFIIALAEIGVITTFVGEIAMILGCTVGLKTSATGITLVAMGTSLPDTFASKTAAQSSPYADSAVGNVTGSNSVNVFLGMGLPWMIGATYWYVNFDAAYEQPAGPLAFSVAVFLGCCLVCFFILGVRRVLVGGELGGREPIRTASAILCFSLWIVYLTASIC